MRKRWLVLLLVFVFTISTTLAAEPKVTIICEDGPQFELINQEGIRVLMDVSDPNSLSYSPVSGDILVATHSHPDHYLPHFANSFPGKLLLFKTGVLKETSVQVTGIASAHNTADEFLPEGGTNYIMLIEMDGLRIAHFGGIGQEKLTAEQLNALGEIDIAITQFKNGYSGMNIENLKGFNLMDQLIPKLIIPTHFDEETARYAVKKWAGFYTDGPLKISKTDLKASNTKILFMGSWGKISKGLKIAKKW